MAGKKRSHAIKESATNKDNKQGVHFSRISISNFRCFKDFTIDSLERINLIGGRNSVGKTTFLEALFLLLGATNIELILKINAFRGVERFEGDASSIRETLWSHLFNKFNDKETISIKSELANNKQIRIILKQSNGSSKTIHTGAFSEELIQRNNPDVLYTPLPTGLTSQPIVSTIGQTTSTTQALSMIYHDIRGKQYNVKLQIDPRGIFIPPPIIDSGFPGIFLSAKFRTSQQEIAKRYGQLEISGSHYDLLNALKIIEPNLKRISTITGASGSILYGDTGMRRMIPLSIMGDGLIGLANILLAISSASGGIVLIDEIENGLHYSVLVKVWQVIAEVARLYNTQIFATTHSWECIKAAHEAFIISETYDFRYHRFQEKVEDIEAITLDKEVLQTTIESGWEIR